ncbi:MAPEG family protein [Faunimonas sp. B44]|uniref:MAPEG family protein n=1 Tax=Faunimonas sp. B44 TaxID=3461493 RepID=UPI00404452D7
MSGPLSLYPPILAQIALTIAILLWTGRARIAALRAGRVSIPEVALSGDPWPDDVRQIANNFRNQFETPVLFYVLCILATEIGATGLPLVLLAWAFVAARVLHTAIHVTTNNVRHRFFAFLLGTAVLIVMWLIVAVRLLET